MGGLLLGPRPWLDVTAGGDWGGRPSIPDGPEKEPFLWEWKGALDLRKPGSDRRLEDALRGPGGGIGLPRKEKLPPELMEAARRLYSKMALVPWRRRAGWCVSSPLDSLHFLTWTLHSLSMSDSVTGSVIICATHQTRTRQTEEVKITRLGTTGQNDS